MDIVLIVTGCAVSVLGLGYIAVKQLAPWILLDIKYLRRMIPAVAKFMSQVNRGDFLIECFEKRVKETPDKAFVIFEGQTFTYKEVNRKAEDIARLGRQVLELKKDDVVALMMKNSPDFIWTFFGLLKLSVVVSMINYNLRRKSLMHCLTVSETDVLIVGNDSDILDAVENIYSDMKLKVYVYGQPSKAVPTQFERLDQMMSRVDETETIDSSIRAGQKLSDPAIYVFTSGTTGLPKPAIVTLQKMLAGAIVANVAGIRSDDVSYIALPLYHSFALVGGVGSTVILGYTCVLARTFSRTQFFPDCRKYGVTVMLYIGELCRYLLTSESNELDSKHNIRLAVGNGLRYDIFKTFKERFKIPIIAEFYASTEGNLGFMNLTQVQGSCGRFSPLLSFLLPAGLYKWNVEDESLVRDGRGFCVPVKSGEMGLMLTAISKRSPFVGYKGRKEATESKIIRNVRAKDDMYFNTGDLMRQDSQYNLFFCDRIGDTFRWKGENVSTVEVSNSLAEVDFIIDACVYGVAIPGYDGKAGMSTILLTTNTLETEYVVTKIWDHCQQALPAYAIPLFLRIEYEALEMTSTIKQTKVKLKAEGYNKNIVNDKLFYFDRGSKQYKELTTQAYSDILDKKINF